MLEASKLYLYLQTHECSSLLIPSKDISPLLMLCCSFHYLLYFAKWAYQFAKWILVPNGVGSKFTC